MGLRRCALRRQRSFAAGVYRVCGACALQAQMCSCVRNCVQRATGQAAVADVSAVTVTCDCLGFCWACVRVRTPPLPTPPCKQACGCLHAWMHRIMGFGSKYVLFVSNLG